MSTKRTQTPVSGVAVVLLSGGIDSAACVQFYLDEHYSVRGLFIDYRQPAAAAEIASATAIAKHYGIDLDVLRLDGPQQTFSGEIRGRNLALASLALQFAAPETTCVVLGIHSGTGYYDCSPAFIESLSRVFDGYADGAVQITAPFLIWTKRDIIDYCRLKHVPLHLCWSCEASSSVRCGRCPSCRDVEAFLGAGA